MFFVTFKFANFRLKFFKTVFYTIARGRGACVGIFLITKESYTCNALSVSLSVGVRRQISTRTLRRSAVAVDGDGCCGCGTGGRESVLEG